MSAGDSGKKVECCQTCGKDLEAFERYMDCPKKPRTGGAKSQHGPFTPLVGQGNAYMPTKTYPLF